MIDNNNINESIFIVQNPPPEKRSPLSLYVLGGVTNLRGYG